MHKLTSLGLFLLLVVTAIIIGGQFTGGDWYQTMNQPSWNPPAIVMASVWAVLYVLMAISAWMVWDAIRGSAAAALIWWVVQLLLSICWSWTYFGMHRPGWALAIMSLWLLVVFIVIVTFRSIKPQASNLMLPVAGWLLFLWVLNLVQWHMNGGALASFF